MDPADSLVGAESAVVAKSYRCGFMEEAQTQGMQSAPHWPGGEDRGRGPVDGLLEASMLGQPDPILFSPAKVRFRSSGSRSWR